VKEGGVDKQVPHSELWNCYKLLSSGILVQVMLSMSDLSTSDQCYFSRHWSVEFWLIRSQQRVIMSWIYCR